MTKANINDRSSVESLYPLLAFEQDASENARDKATVMRGVKILSEPDADGSFDLVRAAQHVGEGDPDGDSIFLVPQLSQSGAAQSGSPYDNSVEPIAPRPVEDEYAAFVAGIVEAARNVQFKAPIGFGDERIKGFRGG